MNSKRICLCFKENFVKELKKKAKEKNMRLSEYVRYLAYKEWDK